MIGAWWIWQCPLLNEKECGGCRLKKFATEVVANQFFSSFFFFFGQGICSNSFIQFFWHFNFFFLLLLIDFGLPILELNNLCCGGRNINWPRNVIVKIIFVTLSLLSWAISYVIDQLITNSSIDEKKKKKR